MDEAQREPLCSACGHTWNPEVCPDCGSGFRIKTLAEIIYDREGNRCSACFHAWQPTNLSDRDACPECGSAEFSDAYRHIPDLASENPALFLIYVAESCIPRDERGAILAREMVAWLRLHGVHTRAEILQWEEWFRAIGGFRSRVQEELMPTGDGGGEKPEED